MTSDPKNSSCQPQAHGAAEPGGEECPICGRPRCTARSKSRTGERCRRNPRKGARVCRSHGAANGTPAAAAAEQRVADAAADAKVQALIPSLGSVQPVKDPLDLLARVAALLEHATDSATARVNDLQGKVATGPDLSKLRGEVLLWERLLGRLTQAAGDMAKLNIFEKQAALRERDGDLVVAAFTAAVESVPDLRVDQAQLLLAHFLEGVGRPQPLELEGPAAS